MSYCNPSQPYKLDNMITRISDLQLFIQQGYHSYIRSSATNNNNIWIYLIIWYLIFCMLSFFRQFLFEDKRQKDGENHPSYDELFKQRNQVFNLVFAHICVFKVWQDTVSWVPQCPSPCVCVKTACLLSFLLKFFSKKLVDRTWEDITAVDRKRDNFIKRKYLLSVVCVGI